jgi:hypothetical protein
VVDTLCSRLSSYAMAIDDGMNCNCLNQAFTRFEPQSGF